MKLRWDPCVVQDATEFDSFLAGYVNVEKRRCLLIGGAGFDPRATLVPRKFSGLRGCRVDGLFFREERVLDQPLLRQRADANEASIRGLLPQATFPRIDIFADGVTAVGGRRALEAIGALDYPAFTDIYVDISALSCGVFFSVVAFLVNAFGRGAVPGLNLHLLAAEQPGIDHNIHGVPAETASMLHGFKGTRSLDGSESEALLWIPTLSPGERDPLAKIYQFIQRTDTPIDVCPIVPFPCSDPRLPDCLVEEYREHLATWRADHRNFLYAAQSDPLDSYRAISALCENRHRIFQNLGGSQVVLSPFGNKMMSLGAMLAAIEKGLPVAMVESIGYEADSAVETECKEGILRHVWLCGEAYAE
ncbi:MAG: hypothetical protein ABSH34_13820 [Verrucomicrobiota bacterium]|jgi:hypothetical protein